MNRINQDLLKALELIRVKHTPGPWKIVEETDTLDNLIIEGQRWPGNEGQNPVVAEVWSMIPDRIIDQANARLIAAAPDLLAACEAAKHAIVYMTKRFPDELGVIDAQVGTLEKIKAAIAKANDEEVPA